MLLGFILHQFRPPSPPLTYFIFNFERQILYKKSQQIHLNFMMNVKIFFVDITLNRLTDKAVF